jgi:hypothetical protein
VVANEMKEELCNIVLAYEMEEELSSKNWRKKSK